MAKADDLKAAFLAEFGEKATQSTTGRLLGFKQHDDETAVGLWSTEDGPASENQEAYTAPADDEE